MVWDGCGAVQRYDGNFIIVERGVCCGEAQLSLGRVR